MIVLRVRNVNEALPAGVAMLLKDGVERSTRNGPALVAPEPVCTTYERPQERVLMCAVRDANPFFHLAEAIWMIAGRNDVAFPAFFARQIREYSDDGVTFHGAYGHRWRTHFGRDQVGAIIGNLKREPGCRRQVLGMWDPRVDLGRAGRDVPCNLTAHFQVGADGRLAMTVFQRSGDMVWGVYGANAVHFSMLQEFIAGQIGRDVGLYHHITSNFHAYLDTLSPLRGLATEAAAVEYPPIIAMASADTGWMDDAEGFCNWESAFTTPFFSRVVGPLRQSYQQYKAHTQPAAFWAVRATLERDCLPCDWRTAAEAWIDRREDRWLLKETGR